VPPSEFISRVSQVAEKDVYELIQNYFYDTDPVVVAHGPLEEMADYAIIRSWTYCMSHTCFFFFFVCLFDWIEEDSYFILFYSIFLFVQSNVLGSRW
jgi:hypothetical protein